MNHKKESFWYSCLYWLPKNMLSHCAGYLVGIRLPRFLAIAINSWFARFFAINLEESEKPLDHYPSLQEFFIRRLKPGARPIAQGNVIVSPCDGLVCQIGSINEGSLIQAKGKYYSLKDLVLDEQLENKFYDGHFITIYLSPKDYHRFHAPISAVVQKTIHVPGALWPVNQWAVHNVEQLFCKNERMITFMTHEKNNLHMAHIAVGAYMVGKIELEYLKWEQNKHMKTKNYFIEHQGIMLEAGQEMGRFMFGSTIVLLMERGLVADWAVKNSSFIKMGECLARIA